MALWCSVAWAEGSQEQVRVCYEHYLNLDIQVKSEPTVVISTPVKRGSRGFSSEIEENRETFPKDGGVTKQPNRHRWTHRGPVLSYVYQLVFHFGKDAYCHSLNGKCPLQVFVHCSVLADVGIL